MGVTPWAFAQPPASTRHATVTLVVFGALAREEPLSAAKFGVPDGVTPDVRRFVRADDPGWFDGWRSGSMSAIAKSDLGADTAVLAAADVLHVITADASGPTDLRYLQGAWAFARYLVACGATTVLDAHAVRFVAGHALPPPGPLDVAHEIRVVYETDSARPDHAHALHTRGMRKFGAPDLVALCADDDVRLVSSAIGELADAVARGQDLGTPRHRVDVMPGVVWVVVPDEHRLGDLLQLNNAARVVVDSEGHDLVGVAARLRRRPS